MKVRRLLRGAAAVLGGMLFLSGCWTLTGPYTIMPGTSMADPGVLITAGGYHIFATNYFVFHIPHASSGSLTGSYSGVNDALPNSPAWALGNFWGPEAVQVGSYYYLFYSATVAWDGSPAGEHAIGVARSTNPGGPYTPIGTGPVYRDNVNHNGVIDPDVVYDYNGHYFLIWSVDWGRGGRYSSVTRSIQGCQLRSDMLGCASGVATLLTANRSTWEAGTVEAPALVSGGDGKYHLFYSGGNFEGANGHPYGEAEALCGTTPLSACSRITTTPWATNGWNGMTNPGGVDLVPYYYGVYAAVGHTDVGGGKREPRVEFLSWQN